MGYGLVLKELFKYRFKAVVNLVEKIRLFLSGNLHKNEAEVSLLWSILITYACTTDCYYCVQNYSFKNGRKDSPLKGKISAEDWLLLNKIPERPEMIVITGGEPFLYKDLAKVIAGLSGFLQVWIVTNLTIDVIETISKLKSINTHKILFHCSYHETGIDFDIFLSRVLQIKNAGLPSVSM